MIDKINFKHTSGLSPTTNDVLNLEMAIKDINQSQDFVYLKRHKTSQIILKLRLLQSAKSLLSQIQANEMNTSTREQSQDLNDYNTSTSISKRKASIKKFYSRLKSTSKSE